MKTSSPIDLSLLLAPDAIEEVSFEQILAARKSAFLQRVPAELRSSVQVAVDMDSEPLAMLLQESSYREMLLRELINHRVRSVLLAFAKGADLEHIAARYYIQRLVVQQEDITVSPPEPLIMESDEALLERIQDAYEGLSIAGPRGAYEFHARSADGRVLDAKAHSPAPAEIEVAVLSAEDGDGTASPDLQKVVDARLNDEEIRPLGDRVTIRSAEVVHYAIRAKLHMRTSGPGRDQAVADATTKMADFAYRRRRLGQSIWLSKIDSLLHVEGVERVEILEPTADLVLSWYQAGHCVAIDVHDADQTVLGAS